MTQNICKHCGGTGVEPPATPTGMSLLDLLNNKTNRKFRVLPRGSKALLKIFTIEEVETALDNLIADDWHSERIGELSSDYLLRASTIDKWLNYKVNTKKFV